MALSTHVGSVLCILASLVQLTEAYCTYYCFYWHWYFWFGIFWLIFFIVMGVCVCIRKINQKKRTTRPMGVAVVHTSNQGHPPPRQPAAPIKAPAYTTPSQPPPAYNSVYNQPPPAQPTGGQYPPPYPPPPAPAYSDPAYPPGANMANPV